MKTVPKTLIAMALVGVVTPFLVHAQHEENVVAAQKQEQSAQAVPIVIAPIAIARQYIEGRDLLAGNPADFDGQGGITQEGEPKQFSSRTFHEGKISVSVYESEPGTVRIDGLPYDEFIQILEGRLILTPDGGEAMEFKQGDYLVIPKGYHGSWHMPEKYRELIVVNAH